MNLLMLVDGDLVQAESECFLNQATKLVDFVLFVVLFQTCGKPGLLGKSLLSKLEPLRARLWEGGHLLVERCEAIKTFLLIPVERQLVLSRSWLIISRSLDLINRVFQVFQLDLKCIYSHICRILEFMLHSNIRFLLLFRHQIF